MAPFVIAAIVAAGMFGSGTTLKVVEPTNVTAVKVGTVLQVAGVGTLVGGAIGGAIGASSGVLAVPVTIGSILGGVTLGVPTAYYIEHPMGN